MKKIILLLFFILSFSLNAQMRARLYFNDLNQEDLKGKVRELTSIQYEPDYEPNGKMELKVKWIFLVNNNFTIKFNRLGYVEEKLELIESKDSITVRGKWQYDYDSANRISKETRSTTNSRWDYNYVGDSITKIKKVDLSNYYSPEYFYYTQRGNKEIYRMVNADSSYISKSIYTYDKHMRTIRIENYENSSTVKNNFIIVYSDSISKKIKNTTLQGNKNSPLECSFKYNKKNNIIKRTIISSKKTEITLYEYVYDKNSNWIECKEFDVNHKLKCVTKRDITYYD